MEVNPPVESTGRALRATVILVSVGICLALAWGLKHVFRSDTDTTADPALARNNSSFQIKHNNKPQPAAPSTVPQAESTGSVKTGVAKTVAKPVLPVPPAEAVTVAPAAPPTAPTATEPVATSAGVTLPRFTEESVPGTAIIFGKVTLTGTPEPEKLLPMDPKCGELHPGAKPTTQFYIVGPDKGLADVFVYISKGLEGQRFLPAKEHLVLDQKGCIYVPYVSGAMLGQTIEVRNSDPVLHNVHPMPVVAGNREYNRAQMPKGQPLLFTWDKEELFLKFKCDVHPWMFAYVSLLPHPYFTVTDANGNFAIPNVPPGKYTVELYHRKSGKITRDVTVQSDGTVEINESLQAVR